MGSLTDQPVAKSLLRFGVPITIGGILTQLYSMTDALIVGRFAGVNALAAIGAGYPIILLLIALMAGIGAGSEILIARRLGEGNHNAAKRVQDSLLTLILLIAVAVTVTGALLSRPVLQLISTPDAVLDEATGYLRIYFFGLTGIAGYNTLAGMIRSTGNSLMPTILLAGCCLLNAALDLWLVAGFNMGVRGAAAATVAAQTVSFIACLWYVNTRRGYIPYRVKRLEMDRDCLKEGLRLGLPLTAQRAVAGIGMVLLQSVVNGLGVSVITAYTLGCRIDSFAAMPVIGASQAVCVFTSQNLGAGRQESVWEAYRLGLRWCYAFAALLLVLFWAFGAHICALFVDDAQVVRYGWDYIRILSISYFFAAYFEVTHGVVRGAGNTLLPTVSGVFGLFGVRLPLAVLLAGALGYLGVWLSIPAGWAVTFLITLVYIQSGRLKKRMTGLPGKVNL
ncbi:MAG: MATE family efflux transporter [Eubacteriales bacterium]